MAKPEWGVKRFCHSCGAAYYDLCKEQPVCPKCGAAYDPEAILKSKRGRSVAPDEKPVAKVVAQVPVDPEIEIEIEEPELPEDEDALVDAEGVEDEEDEDLIEDASELGVDEDDMSEVMEHIEESDER